MICSCENHSVVLFCTCAHNTHQSRFMDRRQGVRIVLMGWDVQAFASGGDAGCGMRLIGEAGCKKIWNALVKDQG